MSEGREFLAARSQQERMRDYYEVLDVAINANEDEIKSAYRKAALRWHPDRNYGNVEVATKEFADAQAAYEVLSVPDDRAWYDRHRASILRGDVGLDVSQDSEGTLCATDIDAYYHILATAKLDDSDGGFFAECRKLFAKIVDQEDASCEQQGMDLTGLPTFGDSNTDQEQVKSFYSSWSSFRSCRTFAWAEQYRTHHAADRRMRRAMDKENLKARLTERREFNTTIQKLLKVIKKRDFRYITRSIAKAQRQDLRAASKAQAQAARAANQAQTEAFEEQDWQKVDAKQQAEEEMAAYDWVEKQIECVACNKTFKNEKTFAAHEKSRKHLKIVKQLRWQLRKEAAAAGIASEQSEDEFFSLSEDEESKETGDQVHTEPTCSANESESDVPIHSGSDEEKENADCETADYVDEETHLRRLSADNSGLRSTKKAKAKSKVKKRTKRT